MRIIVFLLMMTPMLGHSVDLTLGPDGLLKSFPVCHIKGKGIPIIRSRDKVWEHNFLFAASSTNSHGNSVIYIDPDAFSETPAVFQVWVSRHECYHHVALHRGTAFGFHPNFHPADERQADRMATHHAIKYGFTDTQLKMIYDTIKDVNLYTRNESLIAKEIREQNGVSLDDDLSRRAEAFKDDVMIIRFRQNMTVHTMQW